MILIVLIVVGCVAYCIWDHYHHKELLEAAGRCVFVTGCDSGFGSALARHLDNLGCHVFAGCYTDKGQEELRRDLKSVTPLTIHIDDTASIEAAYRIVEKALDGRDLWAVVNNAGVGGTGGPVEFQTRKDLLDTFNVNMAGTAEVGRVFLPLLKKSRGRLVNCVSMAGRVGFPAMGNYVASKYAMEGYSDVQRRELAMWGIKVSILNPGLFRTGIVNLETFRESKERQWAALSSEVQEQYGEDFKEKAIAASLKLMTDQASGDISPVVEAYTHALFAKNPRHRYKPGTDSRFLLFLSLFSGGVLDRFFNARGLGATPKALQK